MLKTIAKVVSAKCVIQRYCGYAIQDRSDVCQIKLNSVFAINPYQFHSSFIFNYHFWSYYSTSKLNGQLKSLLIGQHILNCTFLFLRIWITNSDPSSKWSFTVKIFESINIQLFKILIAWIMCDQKSVHMSRITIDKAKSFYLRIRYNLIAPNKLHNWIQRINLI